jgi:hypothetical protein
LGIYKKEICYAIIKVNAPSKNCADNRETVRRKAAPSGIALENILNGKVKSTILCR